MLELNSSRVQYPRKVNIWDDIGMIVPHYDDDAADDGSDYPNRFKVTYSTT